MKKTLFFIPCLFLLVLVSCNRPKQAAFAAEPASYEPQTLTQEYWYAMGNYMASNYSQSFEDMDIQAFVAGIRAFEGGTELTYAQVDDVAGRYYDQMVTRMAAGNLAAAEAFLAENAEKEGVVTTPSGLQYMVVREGEGSKPTAGSTVNVIYTLTLLDGSVADTSSGNAVSFPVSGVIPGFAEALMLMNPGSSMKVWIHPDLGYGKSITPSIEPQSLLIFDIELVSFE